MSSVATVTADLASSGVSRAATVTGYSMSLRCRPQATIPFKSGAELAPNRHLDDIVAPTCRWAQSLLCEQRGTGKTCRVIGQGECAIGVSIRNACRRVKRAARFRQPLLTIGGSARQFLKFAATQQSLDFGFASQPSAH